MAPKWSFLTVGLDAISDRHQTSSQTPHVKYGGYRIMLWRSTVQQDNDLKQKGTQIWFDNKVNVLDCPNQSPDKDSWSTCNLTKHEQLCKESSKIAVYRCVWQIETYLHTLSTGTDAKGVSSRYGLEWDEDLRTCFTSYIFLINQHQKPKENKIILTGILLRKAVCVWDTNPSIFY